MWLGGWKYLDQIEHKLSGLAKINERLERQILSLSNALTDFELKGGQENKQNLITTTELFKKDVLSVTKYFRQYESMVFTDTSLGDQILKLQEMAELHERIINSILISSNEPGLMFDRITFIQLEKSKVITTVNVISELVHEQIDITHLYIDLWVLTFSFLIIITLWQFYKKSYFKSVVTIELLNKEKANLEKLLEETQIATENGIWEIDLVKNETKWSSMIYKLFEVDEESKPSIAEEFQMILDEDRKVLLAALKEIRRRKNTSEVEIGLRSHKGTFKWIKMSLRPITINSSVSRIIATVEDISKKKELEQQFWSLYYGMCSPLLIINDTKIVHSNPSALSLFEVDDLKYFENNHIASFMPMYQFENNSSTSHFRSILEKLESENELTEQIIFRRSSGELFTAKVRFIKFLSAGKKTTLLAIDRDAEYFKMKELLESVKYQKQQILYQVHDTVGKLQARFYFLSDKYKNSYSDISRTFIDLAKDFDSEVDDFESKVNVLDHNGDEIELSQWVSTVTSKLKKTLSDYNVEFRNEGSFHGVFKFRHNEIWADLKQVLPKIKDHLIENEEINVVIHLNNQAIRSKLTIDFSFPKFNLDEDDFESLKEQLSHSRKNSNLEVARESTGIKVRFSFGLYQLFGNNNEHFSIEKNQSIQNEDYFLFLEKLIKNAKRELDNNELALFESTMKEVSFMLIRINKSTLASIAFRASVNARALMYDQCRILWIDLYDEVSRLKKSYSTNLPKLSA